MSLEDMFQPRMLMNEAGGEGGAGGGGAPAGGEGDGSHGSGTPTGDGGGEGALDMKALLGEEYVKNPNISKFLESENPVQELAKSLVEAQKQIGKPKVGVPGEQATDEEKSAFWKELGVPEDAAGYEFEKPEGVPDELYDPEHAQKWAGLLKEHNIPKEAASALRQEMMNEAVEQHEAATKALNEAMDTAFGDKKSVISKEVGDLITKAIPDKELREKIQNGLTAEQTPAFALAMGHVMQYMKKTYGMSDSNTGDGGDGTSGKSITELRADAQKMMSSEAYRDAMHKDHTSVKKQVNEMYREIGELTNQAQKR